MTAGTSRRIVLRARPRPAVTADLFALEEAPMPAPGPGQCLIKVLFLSLDPAMRGWINDAPNYSDPVPLDGVMTGFTVGRVTASNHPDYAVGDYVSGRQGWREWAVSDGGDIDRKVDPEQAPISTALHVLGMTGMTACLGLTEVGRPKAGETVVVSTAAGAVGSAVGQIAKLAGCRAVGLTGSDEKVAHCRSLFGYDAAINYKTGTDLAADLEAACPDGIDVYFDNTGGAISDAVLELINVGARIVICGTIGIADPEGPRPNRHLLVKRARMEGFLVLDHFHRLPDAVARMAAWLRDGKLAYREDVTDGLEHAPAALVRLLAGENTGKMLIRVAEDDR